MLIASSFPGTKIVRIGLLWLSVMAVISFSSGLIYLTAQQVLRQSANDPQIQMAEDTAVSLSQGTNPQSLVETGPVVDMKNSLAAYLMAFDEQGQLLASSTRLNGANPVVPRGVFSEVRQKGAARFTWQPESGVRSAAVMVHFGGTHPGFVLAGRSLREVENREDQILMLVGVAWLGALVASIVTSGVFYLIFA